jgi:all-trans-retinol 13,14-reductase
MPTATPYKRANLSEHWDAIVIGSGIGGLTAAVLLARHAGKRVLVLERHYEAGGFTHTFRRPGYDWDVGLHYIGQMQHDSSIRRAFDHVTGGQVQWQPMPDVYDRLLIDGRAFYLTAGLDNFRDGIKQCFPAEAAAIGKYIAAIQSSNRASNLYYAEKAIPGPAAAIAGGLMRAPYLRWARRTTLEVLENLTSNRELIGVLAGQWGDYGLPPAQSSFAIHATIAEHYFAGGSYPIGGAATIAASMAPQIERHGGAVVTSAEVADILLEGTRAVGVRMTDGREFRSSLVFSDAGAGNTFDRLLPSDLAALDSLRSQLRTLRPSTAHISLYVGLDQSDAALGLQGTNLWVYPSYDHDANVARFARDLPHDPDALFPGTYISFPSAKDPDFQNRHPGHATIEAIAMVPYAAFSAWADTRWKRRPEDYEALKQTLAARLRVEIERQVPSVINHIACAELSTPVTTRHFMNASHGEIYGFAATPERYLCRDLGARTPIRGLYLTGQDAAGLGIVGALFGGVISASAALGRNLVSTVTKPGIAKAA